MTQTPRGLRVHIALAGRCNTGKSTLLNCITGQAVSLVSPQAGTTADPVSVPFELLPLGPVIFHDTAGLDEPGGLGALRGGASRKLLTRADMVLVVTDEAGVGPCEKQLMTRLDELRTPYALVFNRHRGDSPPQGAAWCTEAGISWLQTPLMPDGAVATMDSLGLSLRELLIGLAPADADEPVLVIDRVPVGGLVVCVTPVDASAPKGRLIAPQVQLLRELVESHRLTMLVQPQELQTALTRLNTPPALVVADSQVVRQVAGQLPQDLPLTTFSILFSRLKGDLALQAAGARCIDFLPAHAPVLVAEACGHHAQGDDIARVKLPRLLQNFTGMPLEFSYCSGQDFPDDLSRYALVLHCGGCMLSSRAMGRRLACCVAAGVPVTNFGMAISAAQGLLERVLEPLQPEA